MLVIRNDNEKIAETNYWETELSQHGIFYMTLNAGYYRLLVPETDVNFVKEVLNASRVIISQGNTDQLDPPNDNAFEVVFEDGTDNPYALLMRRDNWDRNPAVEDTGWNGKMAIYYKTYKEPVLLFDKVFYRRVDTLPCFDPVPVRVKDPRDPSSWEYE